MNEPIEIALDNVKRLRTSVSTAIKVKIRKVKKEKSFKAPKKQKTISLMKDKVVNLDISQLACYLRTKMNY